MDANQEILIGFGLFIASELLAMSKAKDNSVLQLILHMARELFPYELRRKDAPTKTTRSSILSRLLK